MGQQFYQELLSPFSDSIFPVDCIKETIEIHVYEKSISVIE